MKKYFSIFLLFTSLFLLSGFTKIQSQSTKIIGPIFKTGESIILKGLIDGDVFLVGGNVTVDATISGDLIVVAAQTDVNGTIEGDLRIIAGRADINSIINDDVTIVAAQLKFKEGTIIKNTLTSVARLLDFRGYANKQVRLIGSKVYLNGQVEDSTSITAEEITIGQDANIAKDLTITYYKEPVISDQAIISGDLITTQLTKQDQDNYQSFFKEAKSVNKFTLLIFSQQLTVLIIEILIGSLLIALFPKLAKKLVKVSQKDPSRALGWGFFSLIIIPLFGALLLVTLIGIPVGVLLFILFGLSIYTAKLVISLSIGVKVFKDNKLSSPYRNLSLGLVILTLLKLLPIIGWLAYFILILNGLGAIIIIEKETLKRLRK